MPITVGLYRVVSVPTSHLLGAVGLGEPAAQPDSVPEAERKPCSAKAEMELRKRFGPHLPPGLKIFWGDRKTVVGIEAMSFVLTDGRVPMAGLVQTDPIVPEAIHRMDGALESELKRWGIWTQPDSYEWRAAYEANSR